MRTANMVRRAQGTGESSSNKDNEFRLRRDIGLAGSVAIIAGNMIGSGIFVSPTGVLAGVNNSVGLSLVVWAGCGIISTVGALCFCELGACISISGGDYTYLHLGYGPLVSFAYAWCSTLVSRSTAIAALAVAFGNYAVEPFYSPHCKPPEVLTKTIAASLLLVITIVNCVSLKLSSRLQEVLTLAKFAAMVVIIVGGVVRLCQGDPVGMDNLSEPFRAEDLSGIQFSAVAIAFYQSLWAYDGWNSLNFIAEEVKDSHKTVPRAIIVTMLLITVFYLLVNVSYYAVLTPAEMARSEAVAVTWANRVLGPAAWIITLSVCLSIAGSLHGTIMSGGRVPFAAARRGHLPQVFEMASIHYHTPTPALILNSLLGLIYIIPSDFESLVNAFTFTKWIFLGLSMASIIVLRVRRPEMPRPFKVPLSIPVLAVLFCIYLLVAPLVQHPDVLFLFALAFVLTTPIVYFVFVYKPLKCNGFNRFTIMLQKVMQIAPTEWDDCE